MDFQNEVVERVARSGTWAARRALLTHPGVETTVYQWPLDTADDLSGIHPDALQTVDAALAAGKPSVAFGYLARWINDMRGTRGAAQAREWVVGHRHLASEQDSRLALRAVAGSPDATPDQIQDVFDTDPNDLRYRVADNPAAPPDLLTRLLADPETSVLAAANPSTPMAALSDHIQSATLSPETLAAVLSRPDLPAPIRSAAFDQACAHLATGPTGWHSYASFLDPDRHVLTADEVSRAVTALRDAQRGDSFSDSGVATRLLMQPNASSEDRARLLQIIPAPDSGWYAARCAQDILPHLDRLDIDTVALLVSWLRADPAMVTAVMHRCPQRAVADAVLATYPGSNNVAVRAAKSVLAYAAAEQAPSGEGDPVTAAAQTIVTIGAAASDAAAHAVAEAFSRPDAAAVYAAVLAAKGVATDVRRACAQLLAVLINTDPAAADSLPAAAFTAMARFRDGLPFTDTTLLALADSPNPAARDFVGKTTLTTVLA